MFDINVAGHRAYLFQLIAALGLLDFWESFGFAVLTVPDLGFTRHVRDRPLWERCQGEGYVLVTENRNDDGHDSLERTITDALTPASLPVLTLSNKGRFEHDRSYALFVAETFLEVVDDISGGKYRGVGRVFLPNRSVT